MYINQPTLRSYTDEIGTKFFKLEVFHGCFIPNSLAYTFDYWRFSFRRHCLGYFLALPIGMS